MIGKYGRSRPYYGGGYSNLQFIDSGVLKLDDFEDVDATGYIDVTKKLPAGAIPLGWKIDVLTPFTDALSFAPEDGTKISFYQPSGAAGYIFDFTGMPEYEPEDGTTIAFVQDGANDTITDSENGFAVLELEADDEVYITGSTSNDGVYTIVSAEAGTLTFGDDVFETDEAGIEGIRFRKINNAETGGFVADGLEASDDLIVEDSTSNDATDYTVAASGVKAGSIKLGTDALAETEEGVDGISFSVAATTDAEVSVGVSTDPDRFSANTGESVATAGEIGSLALAAAACDGIDDAQTIRVTVTETTDFTSYDKGTVAGSLALHFFYIGT
jgi:hypothetical protein